MFKWYYSMRPPTSGSSPHVWGWEIPYPRQLGASNHPVTFTLKSPGQRSRWSIEYNTSQIRFSVPYRSKYSSYIDALGAYIMDKRYKGSLSPRSDITPG